MRKRDKFTVYDTDVHAFERIEDTKARAATYEALFKYALYGTEPDFSKLPDEAVGIYEQFRRRGL